MNIKAAHHLPDSPDERVNGISVLLDLNERDGYVFVVANTKKDSADAELFYQLLSEQAHRLAESFGKEANPQHRFEQFLGALNETVAAHIREGRFSLPIKDVRALVGIALDKQMFLSGTGELTALFLHKKPSQRYQVFNLSRNIQTEQALPTWEKAFAVVLDGELHPGDVFCVSDKDLQRTIDQEDLNSILSTLPPMSATEKIRQYFQIKEGLLLLILSCAVTKPIQSSKEALLKTEVSIEQLTETEAETERLLDDQRPSIKGLIQKVAAVTMEKTRRRSRILEEINTENPAVDRLKRLARIISTFLTRFTSRGLKQGTQIAKQLKTKEGRSRLKNNLRGKHSSIPRSTKALGIGVILAVVILVVSIRAISISQTNAAEEALYQEQVATIEELIERAAGAVIYKDENQARTLYQDAQKQLEELAVTTPERQTQVDDLSATIQTALDEVRHLITIPNPPLLADLANVTDGVFGQQLLLEGDNLYILASDGGSYVLNRTQKSFSTEHEGTDTSKAIATTQEEGRRYLLNEQGDILVIDETGFTQTGATDERFVDIFAYADRIYALRPTVDGLEGQIVRLNRDGTSLGSPSEWIDSRTIAMDNATNLSIDGSIYILLENGTIALFENGSQVGWETDTVDPPVTQATAMYTDSDSDFIYLLEAATNRVVVFNKSSGAFVAQYKSDAFSDLTDFTVDESRYSIYLLAGSKLYSIAASHLE